MATVDVQAPPPEAAPAVPDYLADPDAVLKDADAKWRYGRAPDYSKTRKVYAETKKMNHVAGSLPELVQNLVKNWEVEASFKPQLSDWRTIDHENYSFAINGGPPQSAEHMLKVGTYNAIIAPNEYYSPEHSDFSSSHKTFKRMMPTFAWEVIEVYSGPPVVAFKWRHWGTMKNDYVGFNDKGEKVTAKAHGGAIDIYGVTVATVNDKVQLQKVDTYFDPLEMFRQIAPNGVVNKEPKTGAAAEQAEPTTKPAEEHATPETDKHNEVDDSRRSSTELADRTRASEPEDREQKKSIYTSSVTGAEEPSSKGIKTDDDVPEAVNGVDRFLEHPADHVHPHPKDAEEAVKPRPGDAVAAPAGSEETKLTHEEMSKITPMECPFLMNRE